MCVALIDFVTLFRFSQRPRRRNPMMMQSSRRTDENFDRETSEKPNKKKSNETREIIPEAIPASPLSGRFILFLNLVAYLSSYDKKAIKTLRARLAVASHLSITPR